MSIQKEAKSEAAESSNAKMTSNQKELLQQFETPINGRIEIIAKQFEELEIITPMSKDEKDEERKTPI